MFSSESKCVERLDVGTVHMCLTTVSGYLDYLGHCYKPMT